jgi:putative sigma-54 modulation protein
MNIRVTARHTEMGPDLRDYVEQRVQRLARYFDRVDEAHVVLEAEGHRKIADVTVHASRLTVSSEQAAADLRSAFDLAMEKIERQIRRHKERVRNHKGKEPTAIAVERAVSEVPGEPGLVPEALAGAPMTAEEALGRLDELGTRFLVFWNSGTEKVNVIYRRDDGNFGLVEPED